ncbi:MAG: RsmD family RNA methyltransferase [Candidatus Caldarchaeales archaeon]
MNRRFFFLLSGFHEELPFAELRATFDLLDPEYRIVESNGRVVIVETSYKVANKIVERTAYTKLSAILLSETSTDEKEITSSFDTSVLRNFLSPDSRIAVRGFSYGGASIDKNYLEKKLGSKIVEEIPFLRVDLMNPEYIIVFIASPERTYLGILVNVKPKKFFYPRAAGRRPFSIPPAMQPDLSRCLINLSRTRLGGRILDSFAGTGGIMIEGILLGYEVYGVELKKWIAKGALKNLKHFTPSLENIIVGDARNLMFRRCFDSIVTDPPYGRSTTIPDRSLINLITIFFQKCGEYLKEGGCITIVSPEGIHIEDVASSAGYSLREAYRIRVHKNLTRRITIFS